MLAISACASAIVLIDVDVSKAGRDDAWGFFAAWCASLGFKTPAPYAQSRSGGWHFAFRCPVDFKPEEHRGIISIPLSRFRPLAAGEKDSELISIRNRGYCVAPGSVFDGMPYTLFDPAPAPHQPEPALFELLELPVVEYVDGNVVGTSDAADVARLVASLDSFGEFDSEPDWFKYLGAVKLALGDTEKALEVARQMTSDEASEEALMSRWTRLTTRDPGGPKVCRIGTMIHRYREITGKPFPVGKSAQAMFGSIVSPPLAPNSPPCPVPLPDQAALLGPLPDHPELPIGQAHILNDYWAHLPSGKMIYERTGELFSASSVDKHIGRVKDAMKTEGPGTLATTWLSQHRFVKSMGWAPGEPKIIEDRVLTIDGWIRSSGDRTFNRYVPPHIDRVEGDVSRWLNHISALYPGEANHIVQWLAHRVQRPGDKVNHALVFIGSQGIGKDTILKPAITAIGGQNFKQITAKTFFNSEWNDYLQSVVLRINEVHDLGGESRYGFYDATKDVITNPPEAHRINTKHVPQYAAVNVCGVIMTSNHLDALYLAPDDRRHFVCVSARTQEDFSPVYWDDINAWFESGGNEAVAHYLANLDLSRFNAKAPPPKTAAWHMVVAAGVAPESGDLSDVIERMGQPAALTLAMVRSHTPGDSQLRLMFEDAKLRRAIPKRLAECGYVAVTNPDARESGGRWRMPSGKTTIYARQELTEPDRLAAARQITVAAVAPPLAPVRP